MDSTPSLKVIKGPNTGAAYPLDCDRFVLGRNSECGAVIQLTSVSREHAQITRVGKHYFIEDMKSRNGTFVNNQTINQRTPLKNDDRIRICDFIATFIDPRPESDSQDDLELEEHTSRIEVSITNPTNLVLEAQPAEKLRLLIEISNSLTRTMELQTLLPRIPEILFNLFRQADRCFIIQAEGEKLMPRVVKTRRGVDDGTAQFSRSIVRRILKEAQACLFDDANKDNRIQLSQSVVDFRIRSVICAPLCRADGTAFGVIQLDTQDQSKKFTQDDLKMLCGVANQAAISLENARLLDDARRQERLQRDVQLAKKVQESFLPQTSPSLAGYEFCGFYEAAREVSGDYYGYVALPNGRLIAAVGDVAGKGISASLIMAKLSSDFRFCMLAEPELHQALGKLNDFLCDFVGPMDRFVTFCAVAIDPIKHEATIVSAGHPSPLLYSPEEGRLEEAMPDCVGGPPLGYLENLTYESYTVPIKPGESLILYTDGVNESMNVSGEEFKKEGVLRAIQSSGAGASARDICGNLTSAIKSHAAGRDPHDDVTVVVVRRSP